VFQVLKFISRTSNEVCERIVQTELHTDMLDALNWDTSSVDVCQSEKKSRFVTQLIVTLHSIVRKAETARSAFRKYRAMKGVECVDVLQKFRHVTENPVIV